MLTGAIAAQDESASNPAQEARDKRTVEALMRLPNFDMESRPNVKESVARYLKSVSGTPEYLRVVEALNFVDAAPDLLEQALATPNEAEGIEAARVLLRLRQIAMLQEALKSEEPERANAALAVFGRIGNQVSVETIATVIGDSEQDIAYRTFAVRAISKSRRGEMTLVEMVEQGKLDKRLEFAASDVLHASSDSGIKARIEELIPLPESASSEPLPPIATLIERKGDIAAGQIVFETVGTCSKCHKVAGEGKEVGPDLTEIGSKLSREAMYESILAPSAGISHNYESYLVSTIDGTLVTGILQSETDDSVLLKDAEAIVHNIAQDDIEDMVKQTVSIMPAGLQEEMSAKQLVDLVEYLTTLTKKDGVETTESK